MKTEVMQDARERRKRAKAVVKWLEQNEAELTRIEQGTEQIHKHFISAEIDAVNESIDISYSGGKLVLQAIFKAYRDLGYAPNSRPKDDKLSSFSCYWNHPTQDLRLWIRFSSTSCKRVKIGTKMVEQDVYETVCDGE